MVFKNKIIDYIWILAILFLLMPYVSPVKLETDVQPFGILLAFSAWAMSGGGGGLNKSKIQRLDALLIIVSLVYFATTFLTDFGLADILKTGGLLTTIVLSILLAKASDENIKKSIHIYAIIILIVSIAYLLGFSEYFHIFYNYKEINESRGLSVLAPEPTDMAYTSAIVYIVYINLKTEQSKLVRGILLTSIILTGSLLGMIILIYLGIRLAAIHAKKALLMSLVIVVIIINGIEAENLEIESGVIHRLMSIGERMDDIDVLTAILNTSAYYRAVMIDAGTCGALNNFLIPQGYGQFQRNVAEIDRECEITKRYAQYVLIYDPMYIYHVGNDMKVNVAKLLYELGFIGLICIAAMFKKVSTKKHGIFAIILYLVQSTPLGHPTIALILRK